MSKKKDKSPKIWKLPSKKKLKTTKIKNIGSINKKKLRHKKSKLLIKKLLTKKLKKMRIKFHIFKEFKILIRMSIKIKILKKL